MKRAEFNFVWLFAIIAGIAILLLAVYGVTKISDTARYQKDTEIAKKISIITDPLQAGFAEGSFAKINFQSETKINNQCFQENFGKNEISVSTKSRIGVEWNPAGGATAIYNKYIFSNPQQTAKEYYVFSKPFNFPYKVSDLLIITSQEYCFINTPDEIANQVLNLNIPNIAIENCSDGDITVGFGGGGVIEVYGSCISSCGDLGVYSEGSVIKNNQKMPYVGNLIYAAIFSDKQIYDCNVKRLMYRHAKIAELFSEKAELMNSRECNTNLKPDLYLLGATTINATSDNILSINSLVKQIQTKHERELCGVW